MSLKEILKKCSRLAVFEQRKVSREYVELVIYSKDIDKWDKIFSDILGPAAKPAEKKPTKGHLDLARDYGGIRQEQTLFKKKFGDLDVIAMFWPWRDGVKSTLKIALVKRG